MIRTGPERGRAPRRLSRWLDPRGRHLGTWAFVANRITGLGLVAYLYLHLVILSTLLRGPEAWDASRTAWSAACACRPARSPVTRAT